LGGRLDRFSQSHRQFQTRPVKPELRKPLAVQTGAAHSMKREAAGIPPEGFLFSISTSDLGTFDSTADLSINFASLVLVSSERYASSEDTNLTHPLGTDPTRGDVRDAPILESEARVGNVFARL
jgi:hypothetical protein